MKLINVLFFILFTLTQTVYAGFSPASETTYSMLYSIHRECDSINYMHFLSTQICTPEQGIKVFEFAIQDDAVGNDTLPTRIRSLQIKEKNTRFNLANGGRKAALFKGNVMLAEIKINGETLLFDSLLLDVSDNQTDTLSLIISFSENQYRTGAVPFNNDNQSLIWEIKTPEIHLSASSTPLKPVTISTVSYKNKLLVKATRLLFLKQPVNYNQGETSACEITLGAVDQYGNLDTDCADSLFLSTNSCNSVLPVSTVLNKGIAVLTTITFTKAEEFIQLLARGHYLPVNSSNPFSVLSQVEAPRYYRNTANGNLHQTCNWQCSSNPLGPWAEAEQIPDSSSIIQITANTVVLLEHTLKASEIKIDKAAVLLWQGGELILTGNGKPTAAQLLIEGTLVDSSSEELVFKNKATWKLGSEATLIRCRSNSAIPYRDHYLNGIKNIGDTLGGKVGSNWVVRKTGPENPVLLTVGMYYPNLTLENKTDKHWYTATGSSFSGSNSTVNIYGNLTIDTTGIGITLFNYNSNPEPITLRGDLTIGKNSSLKTDSIKIGNKVYEGTGIKVYGNITCEGTLSFCPKKTQNRYALLLCGHHNQNIWSKNEINVNNLTVNKAGGVVWLHTNLNIYHYLMLMNGILITDTNKIILHSSDTLSLSYSPNSYINGTLKRNVLYGNYTFPVRNDRTEDNKVVVKNLNEPVNKFISCTVNAVKEVKQCCDSSMHAVQNGLQLKEVMEQAEWKIQIDSGQTTNPFALQLYFTDKLGLTEMDNNHFVILQRNLTSELYKDWQMPQNTAQLPPLNAPGRIIKYGFAERNEIVKEGKFAIGKTIPLSDPLPVTLNNFRGEKQNKVIKLEWETLTEEKNAGFIVQESIDGETYKDMGFIQGRNESYKIQNYSWSKNIESIQNPYLYYRLKQLDKDGNSSCSKPICITINAIEPNGIRAFANQNTLYLTGTEALLFNYKIYSLSGVLLMEGNNENWQEESNYSYSLPLPSPYCLLYIKLSGGVEYKLRPVQINKL